MFDSIRSSECENLKNRLIEAYQLYNKLTDYDHLVKLVEAVETYKDYLQMHEYC